MVIVESAVLDASRAGSVTGRPRLVAPVSPAGPSWRISKAATSPSTPSLMLIKGVFLPEYSTRAPFKYKAVSFFFDISAQLSLVTNMPFGNPRLSSFIAKVSSYLSLCARTLYLAPKASTPCDSSKTSVANDISDAEPSSVIRNSSSGSPRRSCIAVRMSCCESSDRNFIASKRFDFPLALGPTIAEKGLRSSEKFSKVLKPSISIRVSMFGS